MLPNRTLCALFAQLLLISCATIIVAHPLENAAVAVDALNMVSDTNTSSAVAVAASAATNFSELDAVGQRNLSLLLVTVASDETDSLRRLRRSAEEFGLRLNVFGQGATYSAHAVKLQVLEQALEPYKQRDDLLILYVDGYDVVMNAGATKIINRFITAFPGRRVVFGSDTWSWPDPLLSKRYPPLQQGERFLNSGVYIGYAPTVCAMLTMALNNSARTHDDDDQHVLALMYLDEHIREQQFKMALDHQSNIFLNMNGVAQNVEMRFDEFGNATMYNRLYNTNPLIVHGNGYKRFLLNNIANYIAHEYNVKTNECRTCGLEKKANNLLNLPTILLALIFIKPAVYIDEFLESIVHQSYPKANVHIFIHNKEKNYTDFAINRFLNSTDYKSVTFSVYTVDNLTAINELSLNSTEFKAENFSVSENNENYEIKRQAMQLALNLTVDYLFMVNGNSYLINPRTIETLIERARQTESGILAPLLVENGAQTPIRSNFWQNMHYGYVNAWDYNAIVNGSRRGTWNVAYVHGAMLVSFEKLPRLLQAFVKAKETKLREIESDETETESEEDDRAFDIYREGYKSLYHLFIDNTEDYGFFLEKSDTAAIVRGYVEPSDGIKGWPQIVRP